MKDQFYMVLPSNSSMDYHPDNTASRYTTLLPKQIELPGEWVVGLSEIQFPGNFLHIRNKEDGVVTFSSLTLPNIPSPVAGGAFPLGVSISKSIPVSVYTTMEDVILCLNTDVELQEHFTFRYNNSTGFVSVERLCNEQTSGGLCQNFMHCLKLSDKLTAMLGFSQKEMKFLYYKDTTTGERPATLSRGLPESLFVYSDLCTPYVTGDVQSSLLRVVPFNSAGYTYGATHCTTFPTPYYIPVIKSSFRTIEIDIRNNHGELIPFEYGPLNVTLHFKRID